MKLWFEEADKAVWHRMVRQTGPLQYHAACGWHMTPIGGRIWPQKRHEPGPPLDERCRTCVHEE